MRIDTIIHMHISAGAPLDKMGLRAAKAALVDLQGVRVGSDSIVGQAGQAAKYWHDAKVRCAISGAALMVGLARGGMLRRSLPSRSFVSSDASESGSCLFGRLNHMIQ